MLRLEDQLEEVQKKLKQIKMDPQSRTNHNEDRMITGRLSYNANYFSNRNGTQRTGGRFTEGFRNYRERP
uniref:Reverse transcriptase domain-containing protein n=1 Tax=Heterorhabditis bacteriophora TaxID=37862 RepID=A0A1I7WLN2_HETBA